MGVMSSEEGDRDTAEVVRENAREEGIYRGRVEGLREEREQNMEMLSK